MFHRELVKVNRGPSSLLRHTKGNDEDFFGSSDKVKLKRSVYYGEMIKS